MPPVAALAGGAAGATGLAAYLFQSPSKSLGNSDASVLLPQIRPLKKSEAEDPTVGMTSPVKALDLAAATELLRKEEKSKLFELGNGQRGRCDVVRVASNSPVEDEYMCGTQEGLGGKPWTFWGVFDGHAGWPTSALLKEALVPVVSDELNKLAAGAAPTDVNASIVKAFLSVDDAINAAALRTMNDPEAEPASANVVAAIGPAIAGSCALLALYDPTNTYLRVACVGDSRAVLGRFDANSSTYTAQPLSVDQTGKNPDEYARLAAQHPGEEEKILNRESGRLLGLAVTRAFGDHRWKWREDEITEAQQKYWGTGPRPNAKTPPYLTAEPVIEETTVQLGSAKGSGDFLIMASDGFWDHVSSEDAVECVARWIEAKKAGRLSGPATAPGKRAGKKEDWWLDEGKYVEWRATPEHFVVEDDNVATHLVRNAFGGARRNLFCGVMTAYPPISRNVRDDTTVQVIFFGDV
ncbi:hypothetical protein SLS56_000510 [Neofusicoccum ribis]|uniref:PPM-type phosphatase domain-containing protein n=1 Tax=Neofusicoccum ribis TaxID=45134 RepID=A0ABR3TEW4_9PEZI